MVSESIIHKAGRIDQIVFDYFKKNPKENEVQAKALMEDFINVGVFTKNYKEGLPIRNFLRRLDENNRLDLLKQSKVFRKEVNRYWFFERKEQI